MVNPASPDPSADSSGASSAASSSVPARTAHGDIVPAVGVVALVRFVSELAMLAAFGYVGFQLGDEVATSAALSFALPLAAMGVWGLVVAPRAVRRLPDPARLGVELVLFGSAAAGLVAFGQVWWAIVLGALYLVGTSHGRAGG